VTEESKNKVPMEEMESEEQAAQATEMTAEAKKQRWTTASSPRTT